MRGDRLWRTLRASDTELAVIRSGEPGVGGGEQNENSVAQLADCDRRIRHRG
jgi:hypothetical protein